MAANSNCIHKEKNVWCVVVVKFENVVFVKEHHKNDVTTENFVDVSQPTVI